MPAAIATAGWTGVTFEAAPQAGQDSRDGRGDRVAAGDGGDSATGAGFPGDDDARGAGSASGS